MAMNYCSAILALATMAVISQCKILEITQKNLPNVLKSVQDIEVLFYHPDCSYSSNYKQNFTNFYRKNPNAAAQVVGIVDCSQEKTFCLMHRIAHYPSLNRIYTNLTSASIQPDLYLAKLTPEYQNSDEYLTNSVAQKLKSKPNFIVVLFEEEGMPVQSNHKLQSSKYQDRIFYLSQGRLAQTLYGFVGNKTGCWIFMLKSQETGKIDNYNCGDTYQSVGQLNKTIQKFVAQITKKSIDSAQSIPLQLLDSSNYENDTIMGYKQLKYRLKNEINQLQISGKSKVSLCNYLYVWSSKCEHCDYQYDMKVIQKSIQVAYKQWREEKGISLKQKLHSYDIYNNRNIIYGNVNMSNITGLENKKINNAINSNEKIQIIPDLVAICFSTPDNRALPDNAYLDLHSLAKVISTQNVQNFINQIIKQQHKLITSPAESKEKPKQQSQL